jgi:hypothetical protein
LAARWSDVSAALRGLEGVTRKQGMLGRQWKVKDGLLAWERPLRKSDLEALGETAPKGDILGVRVPMEVKDALLERKTPAYFTIPHFNGYPAILVHLPSIKAAELKSLLAAAWKERTAKKPRAAKKKRSG